VVVGQHCSVVAAVVVVVVEKERAVVGQHRRQKARELLGQSVLLGRVHTFECAPDRAPRRSRRGRAGASGGAAAESVRRERCGKSRGATGGSPCERITRWACFGTVDRCRGR
jgi:hypothetical protein